MAEWAFEIPGDPSPWTIWTRNTAQPIGFQNMQAWQEQIRAHLRPLWYQGGLAAPLKGPVVIDTTFYRPWPRNAPRVKQAAKLRWVAKHILMVPDVGNYRKAFLDALQGIVYYNDSQVIGGQEWKEYAEADGWTAVWIREIENE